MSQQSLAGLGHSNTPKLFKYILSSTDYGVLTLTHVPEGWSDSELTFIRDPKYKGVLQEFSTNELKFEKEGRDYIQTAYEGKGIDYEITVRIEIQNNSSQQYQSYFTGKIDLSTYKINSTEVTVKIIATGFQNVILNREAMKVDLLNTKFIGGGEGSMEQITGMPTTLRLPAYSAQQQTDWLFNAQVDEIASPYNHYLPMEINSDEFPSGQATEQTLEGTTPFFTSNATRTTTLKGNIIVAFGSAIPANLSINIQLRKGITVLQTYTDTAFDEQITFEFAVDEAISLINTDELSFVGVATHDGEEVELTYVTSGVTLSEDIGQDLSGVDLESFAVFEFFARILQLISGEVNPLESEFLGRTDSNPTSYGSDGDGSLMCKTKGRLIREFPIGQETFNANLSDAFNTVNGLQNIGLGFEVRSGVNKAVVEEEAYFFDISDNPNYPDTDSRPYITNQILDLSGIVTDEIIEKEVLPDWYANEIDSGYSKFEYEIVQGLKEFNTKSSYATPIKSVKNKLDLTAKFRFDTQGVNKLRAKPYDTDSTEDVNGDNDVFGFDVKRLGIFTAKTNEDFSLVTGGIDPEQSYNLNFTPRRNLEKHGNRVRSMRLALTDEIQFLETDKNNKLITQKTGETGTKAENGDILVNDLTPGYWIPEAYSFEAPVNEETIAAIQANPYGVIKIASDKWGWILEVQTNNHRNKGEFKLLRTETSVLAVTSVKYGYLYNAYVLADSRKLTASDDWRYFTPADRTNIVTYLGSSVAGGILKSIANFAWNSPNTGASDSLGFHMVGGGVRSGSFANIKNAGILRGQATASNFTLAMIFNYNSAALLDSGITGIKDGSSVRFVKDAPGLADGVTTTYTGNDGKTYNAVVINELYWMTGNLAETRYRNGDEVPTVTDDTEWSNLTTGAKCAYNNDEDNVLI